MSVVAFIALITLAVYCRKRGRRGSCRAILAGTCVLLLAVLCGPVPAYLLAHLQSPYARRPAIQWGKRNAIVLLGAGNAKVGPAAPLVEPFAFSYARIVEAAALYAQCRKTGTDCEVIVSGGDPQHNGASEASTYGRALIRLGVASMDVQGEPNSLNTWQNAQFTQPLLRRYAADRVVLVTSAIHMRRSLLYFANFGIDATPARADYIDAMLSPLPLAYNLAVTDFALHEYGGIAQYYLYRALGWNTPL